MSRQIAILGLGAMGERMARRLLAAGHQLRVWNRSADRAAALAAAGASVASSPRRAVSDADVVIAMVRDDEASRRVWLDSHDGALAGLSPDAVAVESSTLTLAHVRQLHAVFSKEQRRLIDAPVLGSRPQAEAGQLIHLVGGDAANLARVEDVLRQLGAAVHHLGPGSAGTAAKLLANSLFAIQLAAVAEALGMAAKAGLDRQRIADALGSTPVLSPLARGALASMLNAHWAPQFPLQLAVKDLEYHREWSAQQQGDTPMTQAAQQVFTRAAAQGLGDLNLTAVARVFD